MAALSSLRRSLLTGLVLVLLTGSVTVEGAQPVRDSTRGDTLQLRGRLEPLLDTFGAVDQSSASLAEQVTTMADNPLDLNEASAQELSYVPGLSIGVAYRVVRHRRTHGPFERVLDLQTIDGVSTETVQGVRPFLWVEPSAGRNEESTPSLETMISNLELDVLQRFTRDLDLGRGFNEDRFLGSPGRLTTRVRLHYQRQFQLALTLDKDPGEPLRWAPSTDTYGFDHVVGSAALHDVGPLETLVIGDYSAQFGQGVALWQGLRFGKGRDPVSPVLRGGRGLLPYRSASEAGFFRGIGATVEPRDAFFVTAFASRRHLDATIDSTLGRSAPDAPLPVRTIARGGQHRTRGELARKGTFGERTLGGAVEYRSSAIHVGVVGYQSRFDRPLRPGPKPYRRFRPSGRKTSMMSVYGTAHLQDYLFFGEIARSPTATFGGTLGTAVDRGEDLQAILLGRYYPPTLTNFRGSAFGEQSRAQNEFGVYTGVRVRIAEKWRVGAYFDQFRFPWVRFNVPAPSTGWETRAVFEYDPRPWLSTYLQLRAQADEEGTEHLGPGGRTLEGLQEERRYSARWHTEYVFSEALTLRTRVEVARQTTPTTQADGVFLSQGLRLEPTSSLQVDARVALFDTDGFAGRIYAYEHDLLYSFSVPVFFDRGRRSYILIQYEPTSSLTLEAKYGVTRYAHRTTIGSGLNEVQGSRRRDLRFQIRWSL